MYKSGTRTYLLDGGLNNTVPKTTTSNDISFIVFCTNNITQNDVPSQVPEFTGFGIVIALFGIAGFIMHKRSKI